eukprot:CAMPEP_0202704126 /NCGR_PEP_ID=MMETSP1385-20130828/16873_1 /ASSEMBLY_ACC=CAM_ASM_000861 /TAXON_ID=933848 /ORGANISM="Elphidium margaritaceum" /LENGTH=676 /DNA_ID=CAMNT_0049362085 /DNA_START=29 /DNA_END=2055 /DNA_ORIENTATION=-
MALHNILPAPRYEYAVSTNNRPNLPNADYLIVESARLNAQIPPYGHRQGYVPREPSDFGDGGAFPEIHIKQYPLDMGRKSSTKSSLGVVPLRVNEKGEVEYDAILRENMRKEQIMHSKYTDLLPKEINESDLVRPTEDEEAEEIAATRAALDKLVHDKVQSIRPTHTNLHAQAPVTVRYTAGSSGGGEAHASGAHSRLIQIHEMPIDPLDPPRFRHKKLPPRPPSPPVPIMHSPPRQITVEDQRNWKIPPCISNWKNNKGFTLPLHQRLAADGRMLYNHVINDKFAKFSESLLIAERKAREEVEARAQMRMKLKKKQNELREKELAAMAKAAKNSVRYRNNFIQNAHEENNDGDGDGEEDKQRDTSEYDANAAQRFQDEKREKRGQKRKRSRSREHNVSESDTESDEDGDDDDEERRKAFEEREKIRRERERDRRREYRMEKKKRASAGDGGGGTHRQRERDISEKIALGEVNGAQQARGAQSLYDNRLFNQSSGLSAGFAADDAHTLYDRPLFHARATKLYRPSKVDDAVYGLDTHDDDILNARSQQIRPHKSFEGAELNREHAQTRQRSQVGFEFEKYESEASSSEEEQTQKKAQKEQKEEKDVLQTELDRFTSSSASTKATRSTHHKGFMYAAAGGGSVGDNGGGGSGRDRVAFEVADENVGDEQTMQAGLFL